MNPSNRAAPETLKARAAAASTETTAALNQRLIEGTDDERRRLASGTVDGIHYLQVVETVKQLKREGRLEEALQVAMVGVIGAEQEAAAGPDPRVAPWYTEQAAIIMRKLGRHEGEVAVLERWMQAAPDTQKAGSKIEARLAGLRPHGR